MTPPAQAIAPMRAPWLGAHAESPWARVVFAPLGPAGWLMGVGARLHRAAYARRWIDARRLSCRVISVGNLGVGGSGKTPMAAWLAARLHERGHRVALATRGYGRRRSEAVTVVSDGRNVHAQPDRAGDEPLLLAAYAPGVPVLVGPDRGLVGLRCVAAYDVDILVLDDGFQHHRLSRDLEIVTFDGTTGLGNGRVFPRGPLRERPQALQYAHAIGVVGESLPEDDAARIAGLAPGAFRFEARRRALGLRPLAGRVPGREAGLLDPPERLAGADVGLLASLARPDGFARSLEALGARVVARRTFRDHHRYRARDLRGLGAEAALWVTTEKDAVKILPSWVRGARVLVLASDLEVEAPQRLLHWVETALDRRSLLPSRPTQTELGDLGELGGVA